MIEAGYKDITLLGQNVNSYGKDLELEMDFSDLLKMLSGLPGDFVLRFMTSHPKDASKKLFDTMAAFPKIAKHMHLPFQAGNDRVLKAMNRRYTADRYLELIRYAREVMPKIVLTSDVIVGFPGETDEEFEDTLKLVETVEFDALFTFIFSPREGTPARTCLTPLHDRRNRCGLIGCWSFKTGFPKRSTMPMWGKNSVCWWTVPMETFLQPARTGTAGALKRKCRKNWYIPECNNYRKHYLEPDRRNKGGLKTWRN